MWAKRKRKPPTASQSLQNNYKVTGSFSNCENFFTLNELKFVDFRHKVLELPQ